MAFEIADRLRQTEAFDTGAMGVEPDRALADAPGDKRFLPRPHHAHCNIGSAAQQVLVDVAFDVLGGSNVSACLRALPARRDVVGYGFMTAQSSRIWHSLDEPAVGHCEMPNPLHSS